ncbi:GNAT family N-acetyltransferase [Stappia sp. ES.058]|uniref:GNAT family N-acetyltransferase n=1 Tax=Stappia sp. ES.058 TaxID=1881061 RepID=UPI00087CBBA7|nr:GNAT family N-acetyltransferase [Stappia sp. ES.058]SDU30121.1 Acetyltransferase (GNAT) family protein [Stappia sp. ES.058]
MPSLSVDLSGCTDLPAGKIANVVTYLEMHARPPTRFVERPDLRLERIERPDPAQYRRLFRRIGDDWLWFGRLAADDEALVRLLTAPGHGLHYCRNEAGDAVGLLELDFSHPSDVELAYFGLVPEAIGGGAGRWLMNQAIDTAWGRAGTTRFWVHTCTADSPQALGFYMSSGFTPYKRAIEIEDDPRLTGLLPRDVAPRVPLIEG